MIRYTGVVPRLPVRDLNRTIRFYTESLRFDCTLLWPDGQPTFAILERDDVSLQFFLAGTQPGTSPGHAILSFDVSDARAVHETLVERLPIEWGPDVYTYGRREFAILDPDGYMLIFSEETGDRPTTDEP
jgi:catechol 2,3-dioxygenase-like lactoylglutathione lyase family enzyme